MDVIRECVQFGSGLSTLTIEEIRVLDAALRDTHTTPAEEITAMRAMLAIEHALRKSGQLKQAAFATRAAGVAVQDAARRDGVPLPDDAVTRVARAAGQVARALIGGEAVAAEARLFAGVFRQSPSLDKVLLHA